MKKRVRILFLGAVLSVMCACGVEPIKAPTPEPEEPVTTKVSFVGCGDNIIYKGNVMDAKSLAVDGGREYNFKPMYENVVNTIREADIAFINQETLMCGDGYELSYYPTFNSPRDVGYDLIETGYDVINIANNHMLDKGAAGLSRTIEFWKGMDCLMIGGYENNEDYNTLRIIEKNGISIAFLSYTYDTNGFRVPFDSTLAIPYIEDETIIRQLETAKSEADFVAVSVHWGEEGHMTPSDEQRRVAKLMADSGADVIIGHHPHVIQPVEWIEGVNGNRTLCVYSLGNFAAEQAYDYNMVGGMISFDIVKTDGEKPYIENAVFNPTVFHFNSNFRGNKVYFMQDYTPELAAKHGVRGYYKNVLSYEGLVNYAKKTISKEFLPDNM
ncbi:MAG: CapA family protein [Eubacteriales bacterium]|nr:CapA family protein [Eubacteriales bacterium]